MQLAFPKSFLYFQLDAGAVSLGLLQKVPKLEKDSQFSLALESEVRAR